MAERPPVRLTPAQESTARSLIALALSRGLPVGRAREFAAAADAESSLNPAARNPSGATGLFQLLSPGYQRKAQALGGLTNPRANALAILPDYAAYWRRHPNAAPGEAGRDVELSGEGAGFYSRPLAEIPEPGSFRRQLPLALSAYGTSATANPVFGSRNAGVPASSFNPSTPRASVGSVVPGRNPLLAIIQTTRRALGIQGARQDPLAQLLAGRSAASDRPDSFLPPDSPGRADPAPALRPVASNGGPRPFQAGNIAELLHEGVGGPTHSTGEHIHVASTNPQVMLALIAEAQRRGLTAHENPYTGDRVDPVHARNSYHYRTFPGRYHGRKLGEALDVSGPGMGAYEAWVRKTYRRRT